MMLAYNELRYFAVLTLVLIVFTALPFTTQAHESRPIHFDIKETGPGLYTVVWKTPKSIPDFNVPELVFPRDCESVSRETMSGIPGAYVNKQIFNCPRGIAGKTIGFEFPILTPSVSALIRVQTLEGTKHTKLLKAGEHSWQVPEKEDRLSVAKQYTLLGITHIWEGWDHLLFLVCLLIIAGTTRRILITITGFTIAHSITLGLSALNIVNISVPPVEAVIALSIVFLATEIAGQKRDTLTYKFPLMVAVLFGLLHGFGFASVLKDIGLPQTQIPVSLLFFNVGVEIGQVIFIACLLGLYKLLQAISGTQAKSIRRLEKPAAYAVGSIAAFWLIERIHGFFI